MTFAQDYRSDPSVRRLASEIGNNSCIIFIGAGVSVAAGFPSWDALEEKMRTEANLKGCYGPLRIADCYKLYVGERDFSNFLRSVFHTEASPTRIHERLAVPTSIYVTTNFDTLMEDALRTHRGHGKVSKIVNTQTSRWVSVSIQSEHPSVLKIHGCAEDNEGYVIGERDYIEYSDNYAHVNRCLTNLFEKSSVLFLGYSLSDRNVSQLLYNVQKLTKGHSTNKYFVGLDSEKLMADFFEHAYGLKFINVTVGNDNPEDAILHLFDEILSTLTIPDWLWSVLDSLNFYNPSDSVLSLDSPVSAFLMGFDATLRVRLGLGIERQLGVKFPIDLMLKEDLTIRKLIDIASRCQETRQS